MIDLLRGSVDGGDGAGALESRLRARGDDPGDSDGRDERPLDGDEASPDPDVERAARLALAIGPAFEGQLLLKERRGRAASTVGPTGERLIPARGVEARRIDLAATVGPASPSSAPATT